MARPIKVLEIISGLAIEGPLGGIERFTVELSKHLPATGVEPIIYGMWDYGTPGDRYWLSHLQDHGIETIVPARWQEAHPYHSMWDSFRSVRRALAGRQVDIIHSHCQFGDVAALLLKRQLNASAVIRTVHNEREWPRRPGRRLFFSNLLAVLQFHREIGVSQTAVDNLNGRPAARLLRKEAHLCYNSLNLDRFTTPPPAEQVEARRQALGLPADALVLGSVGRLEPQKGYSDLIDAMPAVVDRFPAAHLLIAGDGTLADSLRAQAAASPVSGHVHLVGPQPRIEELYALMTLFVSSSLWEGLPTVLLESIAAGVPIVATDVSGSRELIRDKVNGRLVPAQNPAELAQAISEMLAQRDRAAAMAAQARKRLQRYDIREATRFHAKLYRSMVM